MYGNQEKDPIDVTDLGNQDEDLYLPLAPVLTKEGLESPFVRQK